MSNKFNLKLEKNRFLNEIKAFEKYEKNVSEIKKHVPKTSINRFLVLLRMYYFNSLNTTSGLEGNALMQQHYRNAAASSEVFIDLADKYDCRVPEKKSKIFAQNINEIHDKWFVDVVIDLPEDAKAPILYFFKQQFAFSEFLTPAIFLNPAIIEKRKRFISDTLDNALKIYPFINEKKDSPDEVKTETCKSEKGKTFEAKIISDLIDDKTQAEILYILRHHKEQNILKPIISKSNKWLGISDDKYEFTAFLNALENNLYLINKKKFKNNRERQIIAKWLDIDISDKAINDKTMNNYNKYLDYYKEILPPYFDPESYQLDLPLIKI